MEYDALEQAGELAVLLRRVVLFDEIGLIPEAGEILKRWVGERTVEFLDTLPQIQKLLRWDVRAAWEGDPAAGDEREILLAYPGLLAVTVYRLAHGLWELEQTLLPRLMTEYAHRLTGIDIHPGARIGRSFFIDHGTGVVIGETAVIGDQVKIYQGVTLGGLSTQGGQKLKGAKRHPTIEDRVTIYANATILGGDTVVGHDCVIGASAFLTDSVPPCTTVRMKEQELEYRVRRCPGCAQ